MGYEYALVLNMPEFWIYQCSDLSGLHRVLNMPEYAEIIPEYAWFSLNMSEYARKCVNLPESVWKVFVFHALVVVTCLLEQVITYFSKTYSLKEDEASSLKRQNLIFSIVAGSVWFALNFRLNVFTSKTSNLVLP